MHGNARLHCTHTGRARFRLGSSGASQPAKTRFDQDPLVFVIDHLGFDSVHKSVDSLTTNIQLGEFVQAGEDFETLSGDHTQVVPIPWHPMT